MIMIPVGTSDRAGQKAMAEEILGKLVNGAEFERMAQIYSEDSTRDLGGDWGWIDRGTLTAPLEKVAFNLRPGKVSNIIQLAGNYYILKVEDKRGGVTRPFAEVRDEIEKKLITRRSAGQAGTLARQSASESLHKDVLRFRSPPTPRISLTPIRRSVFDLRSVFTIHPIQFYKNSLTNRSLRATETSETVHDASPHRNYSRRSRRIGPEIIGSALASQKLAT